MLNQIINLPKLRFGEFEGEWVEKKLGDIATFSKGKGISKSNIVKDGKIECIRYGELYTFYGEKIERIKSKTNLDKDNLVFSKSNDIIIPASGETPIDIATASCVLKDNIALSGDLNIIRMDENGLFVSYYLNSSKKIDIARLAQGISVVHLYSSQLKTLKVNLPKKQEQQKIATYLTSIDKKIEQLNQKRTLLESYKKGVMQKIFSQEIRFKRDDGGVFEDWEEEKLKNYLIESRIKGSSGDKAKKLTVKLWGQGVYAKNEIREGSSNTQYYIRKEGQLIYSKLDFLNCAFGLIPKKLDGYESTVDLPCFDFIKDVNKELLLERIKQKNFYKKNGDIADGSRKAKRIHANTFLSYTLFFSCLEEQQKISNFLTSIDQKITQNNQVLEEMKAFKKGLLQQMFV